MMMIMRRRATTVEAHDQLFARTLRVLEQNFDRPGYDLDDLARGVGGVSRRQLQRLFAANNTSFRGERTARRMRRAIELIEKRRPIARVAREVGYTRSDHFACAFRRWYGASPARLATGLRLARSLAERGREPLPPVRAPYYRRVYARWYADRRRFERIAREFHPGSEARMSLGNPHLLDRPDMRTGTARARFPRELASRRRRRVAHRGGRGR